MGKLTFILQYIRLSKRRESVFTQIKTQINGTNIFRDEITYILKTKF